MADLRWNSVNADFNDVNSAMGNSIRGISQAGTVFGDLRKSILDEEQRAVDNAYREKAFDENVRQFGLKHALDEDKLFETGRHNVASEGLTARGQDVQTRGQDLSHSAAMANVGVARDSLALAGREQDLALQDRNTRKQVYNDILGTRQEALAAEEAAQAGFTGPISPEQQTQNEARLKQLRDQLSATTLDNDVRIEIAKQLGVVDTQTPVTGLANTEQARAVAGIEMSQKQQQAYEQSQVKANELVAGLNLGQEDTAALQRAMAMIQQTNPRLKPEVAMSILTSFYPTTGEIFSLGRDKFDVPIFDTDYIVNFDPNDGNNPIAVRIAQAGGTSSNLIGGGNSDTSQIPQQQTPDTQPVNLSGLTPEALDYREQQILKGLPDPESLSTNSEQVQARFNQLYRASYGDMPRSEVANSVLKTLEERALQDARNTLQQMRTKATSDIASERSNRARIEAMSSMYGGNGGWGYYGP